MGNSRLKNVRDFGNLRKFILDAMAVKLSTKNAMAVSILKKLILFGEKRLQ
jgi:hypothetical protein